MKRGRAGRLEVIWWFCLSQLHNIMRVKATGPKQSASFWRQQEPLLQKWFLWLAVVMLMLVTLPVPACWSLTTTSASTPSNTPWHTWKCALPIPFPIHGQTTALIWMRLLKHGLIPWRQNRWREQRPPSSGVWLMHQVFLLGCALAMGVVSLLPSQHGFQTYGAGLEKQPWYPIPFLDKAGVAFVFWPEAIHLIAFCLPPSFAIWCFFSVCPCP